MKKIILSAIGIALLATSCTKKSDSPQPENTQTTVLLTKVTNNTEGDDDYGKVLAEFSYTGKQLSQANIYSYGGGTNKETHTFAYNTQGQLSGSTITHSNVNSYDYVNSTVTYFGSNPNKITFYEEDNTIGSNNTLTYGEGKLTRWLNTNNVDLVYTFDANGNNTKQVATEYYNNNPTGFVYTDQYSTFDSKHNLTSALPNWVYFRVCNQEEGLGYIPGTNNPVSASADGSNVTYSYEYNSNGYPTKITKVSGSDTTSYLYEYKVVE